MRNKQVGLLMVLLVILAMGSILLAACARPGTPSASASKGNNSGGGGNTVHMGNTNFLVSTVTIAKGSKLTLIDDVAVPHIIKNGTWDASGTQKLAQEPGAPAVNLNFTTSGESHDIGPFTTAGTFHLLCTIHTSMNLTVVVK
jgi:plastocyanin